MADINQSFQSFVDSLGSTGVKKIFGDPISAEGRTIIPVAKLAYGFGGGVEYKPSSGGNGREQSSEAVKTESEGTGGGGGIAAMPLGVIEVTRDETRYIPVNNSRKLLGAMAMGLLAGLAFRR